MNENDPNRLGKKEVSEALLLVFAVTVNDTFLTLENVWLLSALCWAKTNMKNNLFSLSV